MLYIFFVGSGTMMTFDMNLAVESVATLQNAIEQTCGINVNKQVLLISGGATLDPSVKVCNYGAGTDTNPIFLFTKFTGEDDFQALAQFSDSDSDMNMRERVEAFENTAADYQTLAARSQLARDFADMALHERMLCNQLVDSQHLQQQGWAAVTANLEDTTNSLKRHIEVLEKESQQYFESRPLYQELLKKFDEAVDMMAKVPLLSSLISQSSETEDEISQPQHTLLTKYCSEPRPDLEKKTEQCKKWIDQFNDETLATLKAEARKVISTAEDPTMKEVKGIEERLFRLNQLMEAASKCAEEQCKYAEALSVHHNRVSSSNDMSVLSDLCRAHQLQLKDMLKNHISLRDSRDRCMKAKVELCENLQTRIKWVTYSQNQIFFLNNKLAIYRENLHRLKDHLSVIQQIHLAPTIYVKTLAEIRRRKNFSTNFLKWASSLSEQALDLHKKEVNSRKAFNSSRSQNFINTLFPGMDDFPPPFATECPKPFDTLLPNISQEDLEHLKKQLPELAGLLLVPPVDQMPQVSHKSVVSDSAFSSEVPSSQCAAGPSQSYTSLQGAQMFRTETPSSSDAAEGVSGAQELPSPVSPFEDPFLSSNSDIEVISKHARAHPGKKTDDSGVECKRIHLTESLVERGEMFSPIEEEQCNVESDGDEFERVDSLPKLYDPCVGTLSDIDNKKGDSDDPKKNIQTTVPTPSSVCVPLPSTEIPQVSPSDERLRTPDSMLTSHDFHSTDYFIDDSMPSSYTESTGASALGKGHHMVKSHHVIVAELQQQLDHKCSVLGDTQGSLPMSQSNVLKLHGTISAFQRSVREVQGQLKTELQFLREAVKQQQSDVVKDVSGVLEKISAVVSKLHDEAEIERMSLISKEVAEQQSLVAADRESIEADLRIKLCKEQQEWLEAQKEEKKQRELMDQTAIECLKEELSEMKEKLQAELIVKLDEKEKDLKARFEQEKEALLAEQRNNFQKEKDQALKKLKDSLQVKFKQEVESMRSRFRLAYSTTSLERSCGSISPDSPLSEEAEKTLSRCMEEMQTKLHDSMGAESRLRASLQAEKTKTEKQSGIINQKKEEIEGYEEQVRKLKAETQTLCESLASMEKHVMDLQSQLEEAIASKKILQETSDMDHEELIEKISKLEENSKVSEEQIACLEKFKNETKEEAAACQEEIRVLTKKLEEMRNARDECESLYMSSEAKLAETKARLENLLLEKENQNKEHENELNEMRILLQSENQKAVSEATTKATKDADEAVESLKAQILSLEEKQKSMDLLLGQTLEECSSLIVESGGSGAAPTEQIKIFMKSIDSIRNRMGFSEVSLDSGDNPLQVFSKKVKDLEKELNKEREKFSKLCNKFSRTTSYNKVSVVTCEPGDIVLFCYDEKHKNYLAFYFGTVPHFLHTESLSLLSLKIPPESPRTSWVLAMVVEKEYCLAKKPVNRFNVPSGSRFFRVKVNPWQTGSSLKYSFYDKVSLTMDVPQTQSVSVPSQSSEASGSGSEPSEISLSASTI